MDKIERGAYKNRVPSDQTEDMIADLLTNSQKFRMRRGLGYKLLDDILINETVSV